LGDDPYSYKGPSAKKFERIRTLATPSSAAHLGSTDVSERRSA
jgi:hypothetical protein